ncbi:MULTISPECIES: PDR/VanB family oxidoreductase [Rhodobacterales]|uniref:PDR/VanB family oxidoreductase n=1 Tax=Rhodobacterales TaxID=204455 RepID=UPI00237F6EE0|nr:PDR/VanB family oxidoreductase [Phaeobacter gallaeciensis]MDE4139123.1 PDR/VanB family oxidoreductase [Phaeobacter gallaeciensis]MDE4147819.1 PDR/VanB family oxidoreductase [Phaeobacter gallaeciensis]MDE4152037.1 PDR/VanB family oxidoreductase [Phaeobacter gallaeciensis]MDE4227179.1 PDR/VanB family oxidoreductase [Phaeobacter gallaeciensis]MDE4256501.1 PDR/VanB family oxidoreductase [Phaeobacter gallaeciensis]
MSKIDGVVLEVTPLTDRISSLIVAATDGRVLPEWEAGAHVEFDVPGGTRAYSLVAFDADMMSAPKEYRITVQREDEGQGGSKAMHALTVGDPVTFAAPKNDFPVKLDAPAVLLAGGIGVTPMISMAAALQAAGQRFAFHYAGRTGAAMAYHERLADTLGEAFHLHCDDDTSALDLDALISGLGDAHLYVCGPRGLLDAVRAKAEGAGIPADHVHFELFTAAEAQEGDSAFEVQINDGRVFTIPADKTIVEVLEEHDVDVLYDCQRGDCGICQCDVIEGVPDHRDVVLSEAERAAGDVMQICVSRAKSARLVLDI